MYAVAGVHELSRDAVRDWRLAVTTSSLAATAIAVAVRHYYTASQGPGTTVPTGDQHP
jgi:hypothetical protein